MIRAGYSPSIRLFEAAACGCPMISDWWEGLDQFFTPGEEILVAHCAKDILHCLFDIPQTKLDLIGQRARARALSAHTAAHRAMELERYALEMLCSTPAGNVLRTSFFAHPPPGRP
jgi:spore maturation protein CgeB